MKSDYIKTTREGRDETPRETKMRVRCEHAIKNARAKATILYFDKTVVIMYDCDINRLRKLVEEFLDVAKDIDCAIIEEL